MILIDATSTNLSCKNSTLVKQEKNLQNILYFSLDLSEIERRTGSGTLSFL